MAAILADVVAELHGVRPVVTSTTALDGLDLDSLAVVAVAMRIEAALGVVMPDEEFADANDVADLARRVGARRGVPPPAEPSRWAFTRPVRLLRRCLEATLVRWFVDSMARPRVRGIENLAAIGEPVLLCPNHTSHLDVPVVRQALHAAMRERTAVAAASDYFFAGGRWGPASRCCWGPSHSGERATCAARLTASATSSTTAGT